MANTKIQHLPTASLSQVASSQDYYLYMADLNSGRDIKFKATDFFTIVRSVGIGASLISSSSFNSVSLKTILSPGDHINIKDGGNGIELGLKEDAINLNKCNNSISSFISEVDLGSNVGTSTLAMVNGGTGANDQASALNLITNSSGGTANQVIKTDGTSASWEGINSLITAGAGLVWDTKTTPYTLDVTLDDVTFTSNITFNNTVTISNQNLGVGTGWISNDGTSEGINIDTTGRIFMGQSAPTAAFDSSNSASLTLAQNLSFNSGATRSINMVAPSTGAGDEFQILGSAPGASNQAGGAITLTGGVGSGTGAGGAINLLAGNSTSGDGDINMSVTDGGTVSQVLKIHGSNKHFTVGSTGANNNAVFDIQNDTAGAACLELDQNDTDEPFIIFTGATGTTGAANIDTEPDGDTSGSTAAAPHSATWTLKGMFRVSINGTDMWTPYYTR